MEGSETKRGLTQEELEKQIERLTREKQAPHVNDPFPVCPTVVRSPEEIEKLVHHLYDEGIESQKKSQRLAQEASQRSHTGDGPAASVKVLTAAELDASIERQYTQAVQQQKDSHAAAREKYLFHSKSKPPTIPLPDFVERMYTSQLQKEKEKEEKLHKKYIEPTDIRSAKMTKDQLAASAQRLTSRGTT